MIQLTANNIHELKVGSYVFYKSPTCERVYIIKNICGLAGWWNTEYLREIFYTADTSFIYNKTVPGTAIISNGYCLLDDSEIHHYNKLKIFSS